MTIKRNNSAVNDQIIDSRNADKASANNADNAASANTVNAELTPEKELELLKKQKTELEAKLKDAKAAKASADKKPRYSRYHALIEALQAKKDGGTKEELAALLDKFTEQHGGNANLSGAKTMLDLHCKLLQLTGQVHQDGKVIKWVGEELAFTDVEFRS